MTPEIIRLLLALAFVPCLISFVIWGYRVWDSPPSRTRDVDLVFAIGSAIPLVIAITVLIKDFFL